MVKEIMTACNVLLVTLLLTGCTILGSSSKTQKDWLFAHIATEAEILNQTTIVMPVTQDIIAFTNKPYLKHADLSGKQFTLLLGDSETEIFKTGPRNAVLSWLDGKSVQEVRVVITGASAKGKSIFYTTETMANMDGIVTVASPHLYLDRYHRKHSKNYPKYPDQRDSYYYMKTEFDFRQSTHTTK